MTTDYLEAGTYIVRLIYTLNDTYKSFNDELELTLEVSSCANTILSDI